MKFEIGDKIVIKKSEKDSKWYSSEVYTIIEFDKDRDKVVVLDRNLPENNGNLIHISYLNSLKKERKKKLLKLKKL